MAAQRVLHLLFPTFAFGLAVGLAGCPRTPAATNLGTAAPDTEAGDTVDSTFDVVEPEETADVIGSSDLAQPADVGPDADTACGLDVWGYLGLPPAESGKNYCKVTVSLGLPCDFEGEWVPHQCSLIRFSTVESDPGCACTGSPAGDLVCVRAGCWDGCACPPGWRCMITFFETTLCVDYGTLVPEPCGIPCYMPGLDCVQLGGAGRFCLEYASDGPCEPGYHKGSASPLKYDGSLADVHDFCIPDDITASACHTAYAKQAQLATPCTMTDGTAGTRHCGPDGLTACAP